jgi:diguanylate cyclase (GGDEF)-like protein
LYRSGLTRKRRFALLAWSNVDKCLLVSAIMWGAAVLFAVMVQYAGGWPYFPSETSPSLLRDVGTQAWWIAGGWAALFALGCVTRRRLPDSGLLVYAVVQYYSIVTALFTYYTGPFAAAGWIAFIGGSIVGFLLFSDVVVAFGILTWLSAIGATAYLAEIDALPMAPLLAVGDDVSLAWIVRNGVITLALCALILPLCSYIISSWRDHDLELEALSKTDALTGVANRRSIMELLDHELRQARRYQHSLTCVMVDLDHFKRVNDDFGHITGDKVLAATADALRKSVRDTDVIGRYGGEEFLLVLPNTDTGGAREVAERCRRTVAEARVGTIGITASFGIATFPDPEIDSVDDLVKTADDALYAAKRDGRDRVAVTAGAC